MLNKILPDKIYHKLSDFWNEYTDCELPEERLRKKFIPKNFNFESREIDSEEARRIKNAKIPKDFDEEEIDEESRKRNEVEEDNKG